MRLYHIACCPVDNFIVDLMTVPVRLYHIAYCPVDIVDLMTVLYVMHGRPFAVHWQNLVKITLSEHITRFSGHQ